MNSFVSRVADNQLRLARAGERTHMDGIGISVNGGSLTDTRRGTSIDSSLLAIDGTLEIHLNDQFEPDTIQGEFFIGDLVEELRGDGLPSEGPFTIAFGVDPQGEPYYEIR